MTKTTSHINDFLLVPKVITNVSSFGRYGDNVDSTVEELVFSLIRMCWFRGVVTALKPVRAEQVRRPEWKQNWTVPHCGSVLPLCLSLRHVGSIHISCLAAREQTSAAQIAKASPPYNMKYFIHFLALSFNSIFNFFLTEAAQYECSYRRTAHHATVLVAISNGMRAVKLCTNKILQILTGGAG